MSGRGHYRDSGPLDCKIWVGNLGKHFDKEDLKAAFSKYGPLESVWVAQNPAGFAFVQFENKYDAEDAVHGLNKKRVCGQTLDVQFSTGESKNRGRRGGGRYGPPRRDISNETCFNCGKRGHFARACRSRRRSRSRSRSRDRRSRSRSRSPRNRSPRRSRERSPRRSRERSPRERSPRDRSPQERSPRERSPRERSPRERSPRERSPRERSPQERSPRERSPQERSPRRSPSKSRSRSRSPRDN